MKKNEPAHHAFPQRDPTLQAIYDLAGDLSALTEEDVNPSFASIAHETDRYERLEEIAAGGMKHIYKAYDRFTRRQVAMAMLAPDTPTDRYDPFVHEAWVTAQLDHPNIIQIHDLGITADHRPFFTMDLKSGHSLRQLVEIQRAKSTACPSDDFQISATFATAGTPRGKRSVI